MAKKCATDRAVNDAIQAALVESYDGFTRVFGVPSLNKGAWIKQQGKNRQKAQQKEKTRYRAHKKLLEYLQLQAEKMINETMGMLPQDIFVLRYETMMSIQFGGIYEQQHPEEWDKPTLTSIFNFFKQYDSRENNSKINKFEGSFLNPLRFAAKKDPTGFMLNLVDRGSSIIERSRRIAHKFIHGIDSSSNTVSNIFRELRQEATKQGFSINEIEQLLVEMGDDGETRYSIPMSIPQTWEAFNAWAESGIGKKFFKHYNTSWNVHSIVGKDGKAIRTVFVVLDRNEVQELNQNREREDLLPPDAEVWVSFVIPDEGDNMAAFVALSKDGKKDNLRTKQKERFNTRMKEIMPVNKLQTGLFTAQTDKAFLDYKGSPISKWADFHYRDSQPSAEILSSLFEALDRWRELDGRIYEEEINYIGEMRDEFNTWKDLAIKKRMATIPIADRQEAYEAALQEVMMVLNTGMEGQFMSFEKAADSHYLIPSLFVSRKALHMPSQYSKMTILTMLEAAHNRTVQRFNEAENDLAYYEAVLMDKDANDVEKSVAIERIDSEEKRRNKLKEQKDTFDYMIRSLIGKTTIEEDERALGTTQKVHAMQKREAWTDRKLKDKTENAIVKYLNNLAYQMEAGRVRIALLKALTSAESDPVQKYLLDYAGFVLGSPEGGANFMGKELISFNSILKVANKFKVPWLKGLKPKELERLVIKHNQFWVHLLLRSGVAVTNTFQMSAVLMDWGSKMFFDAFKVMRLEGKETDPWFAMTKEEWDIVIEATGNLDPMVAFTDLLALGAGYPKWYDVVTPHFKITLLKAFKHKDPKKWFSTNESSLDVILRKTISTMSKRARSFEEKEMLDEIRHRKELLFDVLTGQVEDVQRAKDIIKYIAQELEQTYINQLVDHTIRWVPFGAKPLQSIFTMAGTEAYMRKFQTIVSFLADAQGEKLDITKGKEALLEDGPLKRARYAVGGTLFWMNVAHLPPAFREGGRLFGLFKTYPYFMTERQHKVISNFINSLDENKLSEQIKRATLEALSMTGRAAKRGVFHLPAGASTEDKMANQFIKVIFTRLIASVFSSFILYAGEIGGGLILVKSLKRILFKHKHLSRGVRGLESPPMVLFFSTAILLYNIAMGDWDEDDELEDIIQTAAPPIITLFTNWLITLLKGNDLPDKMIEDVKRLTPEPFETLIEAVD